MASAPSQASSRRSSLSEHRNSSPTQQSPEASSSRNSLTTEPILINNPTRHASDASPKTTPPSTTETSRPVRTCWICQQDDTDDTPENTVWRTPCPCSLEAHDSCLLEWIANEEAPKPGELAHNHHIKCPQCQAEIHIERPKDYLVAVVDRIQRFARGMIIPTALGGTIGCVYSGLLVYGLQSMQFVFGYDEVQAILARNQRPATDRRSWLNTAHRIAGSMDLFFPGTNFQGNLKLFLGLPLIAPALIILRTKMSDQAFALLLPLYFVSDPKNRIIHWPPSPALTFATVPYLRTAYVGLYRYTFGDLEKKWEQAVQRKPREGETAEQIAAAQAQEDREEGGGAIFELEIVHEEFEDEAFQPQQQPPQEVNPGPAVGAAARDPLAPQPQPNQPDQPDQPPRPENQNRPQNRNGWEIQGNVTSSASIASTVIGALFFPAISRLMGDILALTLPSRLVDPNFGSRTVSTLGIFGRTTGKFNLTTKGILKEKWGRSLVGGCLFVVLKDAVVLYCKWKKARDFGKRRVRDWEGRRRGGAVVGSTT